MKKVLIVEDNRLMVSITKDAIEKHLGAEVSVAINYKETRELFRSKDSDFFVALVDVNLPDAPDGQAIDFVIKKGIPVIVFTGGRNDSWHEKFWSKKIVDYVLKDGPDKLTYLIDLINRLKKNQGVKILILNDSVVARSQVKELLEVHGYITLEASNGVNALEIIGNDPGIKVVITNYYLPDMNGDELTKKIRNIASRNRLAVIGLSSSRDKNISTKFLKAGANDFINRPFLNEEFYCRVSQNVQVLEHIETIQDMSNRDYLTNLYNRRYFFDHADRFFTYAKRYYKPLTAAMIDIDYFKKINDSYGHEVGDSVLKKTADHLASSFRSSDIVSRFGGEEFCVLLTGTSKDESIEVMERVRKEIEAMVFDIASNVFTISISIGLCSAIPETLDDMLNCADKLLYQAKETGRNRLVHD